MPETKQILKVLDIMTAKPVICTPETTVTEAAQLMWDADCGILPVIDDGELVGVITDRDMYIALAIRNVRGGELRVGAIATRDLVTCGPADDVHVALEKMKGARVRRLPVVSNGRMVGMVSINDIVRAGGGGSALKDAEIVDVLQSICGPHHIPALRPVA